MVEPVSELFRVALRDLESAAAFGRHVVSAAEPPSGTRALVGAERAVVFQSLNFGEDSEVAYVSSGAVKLLRSKGVPLELDEKPIAFDELPSGLALVIGDAQDADSYFRLHE